MKALLVDLRYALRVRLRRPRLLLLEVGTLTLGLSLISLTINLAHALVGPPAIRDVDRIVGITPAREARVLDFEEVSYPEYREYASHTELFSETAAFGRVTAVLSSADGRGGLGVGEAIAGSYFEAFAIAPARGRLLRAGQPDIVLSHNAWRRLFGGDTQIVGKSVQLGSVPYTVAGIAPAGFTGVFRGVIPDFWIPIETHAATSPRYRREIDNRQNATVWVIGRLRSGVSVADARGAVENISATGRRLSAIASGDFPLHPAMSRTLLQGIAAILFALMILILLITAANFATLTSMRTTSKYGEMVVRLALGAHGRRILQLLIAENTLVAVVSAALAVIVSWWAGFVLSAIRLPLPLQVGLPMGVDVVGIVATAAVALAMSLIVSIVCTLNLWSAALASGLKETATAAGSGGSGRRQARLRHGLVVAEVALSLVLIGLAGLALRGLRLAKSIDIGFDPNGVTSASISPIVAGYPPPRSLQLLDRIVDEVRQLPGVDAVSSAQPVPLSLNARLTRLRTAGDSQTPRDELPLIAAAVIGPDYFRTLRIPLVSGREFTPADDGAHAKVGIVNQSMAAKSWPHENPIGKTVSVGFPEPVAVEVVGVVRDSKMHSLGDHARPAIYTPMRQDPAGASGTALLLRAAGDPRELESHVVAIIRRLAPEVPVFGVQPLNAQIDVVFTLPRFALEFFAVCAAIAILFAALGLYGVIALSMTLRVRELGIRIAVGADERSIFRLAMRSALKFGVCGIVPGVAALAIVGPIMVAILYGVKSADLATLAASVVVTMMLCMLAACVPARRASRLNPVVTLRYQ